MPRTLQPLCDRIGRARVEAVIADFYVRLRADAQLGPFFRAIEDQPSHEAKIVEFWWTAMGGRSPHPPAVDMIGAHTGLGLTDALLERWLEVFDATLRDHLEPELAAAWQQMARGIADRLRAALIASAPPRP